MRREETSAKLAGEQYATLGDALAAVEDGQTIKLLKDIDYYGGIVIEDKSVTFNLNGYTLNVDNPLTDGSDAQRTGLYVKGDAGNASVALEGVGEFNVIGNKYGVYVYAGGINGYKAEATVTNALATGNEGCAAYAYGGNAEVTVEGATTATGVGGIGATAESKGFVTVMGNVTATADDTYTGDYDYCAAVEAWDDGEVIVEGNVTATGFGSIGVLAAGSYVIVEGDVTGDLGGAYATTFAHIRITGNVTADEVGAWILTGSEEDDPSSITIDGIINAPNYIQIGEKVFTFVEGNSYEGRLVYNDESLGSVAVAEFAGGGYEDDPYLVAHAYHLYNVRNHSNKCFRQTEDIDLSLFETDSGWEPIGDSSNAFWGTYDGNDKTIKKLSINRDDTDRVGLFGVVKEDAKIQDLVLEDVNITGGSFVGGLAGWNDGSIDNVSVTGDVTGNDYVGGLAGCNDDGSITGSYFEGTVTGDTYDIGGLVGYNNRGGITDCHADVTVTGEGNYIGGLAGSNLGPITGAYASGTVKGNRNVGGLVGWNDSTGDGNGEIEASYSTGAVEGYTYVGGLVGWNLGPVTASYASGTVMAAMISSAAWRVVIKIQSPTVIP
ncbi:MAG: GLUG motif-containing protein [Firmicutes bacterium]|nr:GLUG motif-containing protein [Bacillota bacterium]